jgi:hypothetical protein
MDTSSLRKNFEAQIKKINEQILGIESDLEKAKEYRAKLAGGLETLDLLENGEDSEISEITEGIQE